MTGFYGLADNQAIIVETLKSANMMQNHKLARAIGDAGWHGFIMKLEYKAQAAGCHLIKLDQWFASSKLCSDCGHKMPDMPLHQRQWACPACGAEHDRDINAARNILGRGRAPLAVGIPVLPRVSGQPEG